MKKYLATIRRPVFYIVVNFFLVNTLFSLLPAALGEAIYNAGRIGIIVYAGWLISRRRVGNIRMSALTGAGMYFIDHVVLKGGIFILNALFKPEGMGCAAFSTVVISFVLFAPLALALGAAGGALARSRAAPTPEEREERSPSV